MSNINYIRAAILDNTGVELTLEEVVNLLLEEGMITHKQSKRMIMRNYNDYFYSNLDNDVIIDRQKDDYTQELVFEEV